MADSFFSPYTRPDGYNEAMSHKTAIYRGRGASTKGFKNWEALFLSERAFFQTDWDLSCSLFILPGGRDVPYHASLQGAGNQKIRSFVERGGTFLGICAGAYFASSFVEFDKGGPQAICEKRDLQFFEGKTVGPLYDTPYIYNSEAGARTVKLITENGSFDAYYNGGCTFIPFKSSHRYRILARYGDLPGEPPAVVECRQGRGKAILSGVHLELPTNSSDQERIFFLNQAIFPSTLPPIK